MSAVRLLPLLALLAVLCACLPLCVVGQDPTTSCYDPMGDSSYGSRGSDLQFYHLVGLNYYASANYNILCAFRAQYVNGPNGAIYGPWHGNPKQDLDDCTGPYSSTFTNTSDWAQLGTGAFSYRTNAANNKTVVVSFLIGRYCSLQDYICAGVGCPGNANYAAEIASLQADPTYHTVNFTAAVSGPAGTVSIVASLNATAATTTTIRSPNPSIYPDRVMSVVTSVQSCYGQKVLSC